MPIHFAGEEKVYTCHKCKKTILSSKGAEHSVACDGELSLIGETLSFIGGTLPRPEKEIPVMDDKPTPKKSEQASNHDPHYRALEIEPFVVMEQRMDDGYLHKNYPNPTQNMTLAIALKHIMRAGLKEGQPWEKDIEKAMNYLNRALTGEWLPTDKTSGD